MLSTTTLRNCKIQQNKALRIALDLLVWTPTEEFHKAANFPTVSVHLAQRNMNYPKKASNNNAAIRELVKDQLRSTTTELHYTTPVQTMLFEPAKERLRNLNSP